MRKILLIARADLLQLFRDRVALIFMLALPFGLTLVTGAAFGGNNTLEDIPVVVVNNDTGQIGASLLAMLESEPLRPLLTVERLDDPNTALERLRADEAAAAIIIPPLSEQIFTSDPQTAAITLLTNPSRPISSSVVRSIVARFADSLNLSLAASSILFSTLAQHNAPPADEAAMQALGATWGETVARSFAQPNTSRITFIAPDEKERAFDPMAYFAPSMAIFALMFTITQGGTTLLVEREQGTLQRMLATPTRLPTILAGKLIGLWLAGWVQLAILLSVSALLFDVSWGNPLAVVAVCVALVIAASGWGALIAALARTSGEAQTVSVIISLLFGAAAGHFFPRSSLPLWLQQASRISPNAWGLDAFTTLITGGSFSSIVPHVVALLLMAGVLFSVATLAARRQLAA